MSALAQFNTIYRKTESGDGLMLQIDADKVVAGDQLLPQQDGQQFEPCTVVVCTVSLLTVEMGPFEIDLRPWKLADGRLGPWPARARRWTSVTRRRALTA